LDLRMLLADAPLWALLLILLAPASLIVSIIWFVITLFAHARTVRREAISSAADRSLKALGERYVPLWHPLDEPISGLSASLSRPPAIAPRAPIQGRPWIRSLLPQIYNHTVAPIIDSLVWWVITGRLQGRDVGGLVLSSCSALPPRVIGRKNLLSGELQQQISSQADSLASQSAVRLRLALNEIGARRKPLASLAQAISWQEVVHTSYFDHARFAEACSELILDQMSGARVDRNLHVGRRQRAELFRTARAVRASRSWHPRGSAAGDRDEPDRLAGLRVASDVAVPDRVDRGECAEAGLFPALGLARLG
jgi:hypothetical protein